MSSAAWDATTPVPPPHPLALQRVSTPDIRIRCHLSDRIDGRPKRRGCRHEPDKRRGVDTCVGGELGHTDQGDNRILSDGTLQAGGLAGTAVDTVLFPLDTIKTRLQCSQGFRAAGAFRGVFKGLLPAVIGSAPGAGCFFVSYETFKALLSSQTGLGDASRHMLSASVGEVSACMVRVPTEVIKQNMQVGHQKSMASAVLSIFRTHGVLGLYRGYLSTVWREIPFTCIQFPLYEKFKTELAAHQQKDEVSATAAGLCGSVAGGIAAALTTPFDVIKTRLMTARTHHAPVTTMIREMIATESPLVFFAGIIPRTVWISLGGFVFLGAYEKARGWLRSASG